MAVGEWTKLVKAVTWMRFPVDFCGAFDEHLISQQERINTVLLSTNLY